LKCGSSIITQATSNSQLHRQRQAAPGEAPDEILQVLDRAVVRLEGDGELGQHGAELAGVGQRRQPGHELVDVLLAQLGAGAGGLLEHLRVGELLPQLGGEAEVVRHPGRPAARGLGAGRPVEGAVDLDRVEVLGVEAELVAVG